MNTAIIIYCPNGFQNDGTRSIRHNIKGAIARGRGVCNKVSVRPFDRVADLRRRLRWRESKILNLNLDDGGVGRSGAKYEQANAPQRTSLQSRRDLLRVLLMTLEDFQTGCK